MAAQGGSAPATLVVGATGILLPAVSTLLSTGCHVVGVSRGRRPDPGPADVGLTGRLVRLNADAGSPLFLPVLDDVLQSAGLALAAAIVYAPASSPEVVQTLARRCPEGLVEVLTSAVAAPLDGSDEWSLTELPPADPPRRRLVLGWRRTCPATSWHRPDEVSAAAMRTLTGSGDLLLGVVRPWSQRPA